MQILELIGDLLLKKPTESAYEERCLIIFGIPVVASERLEKLKTVLGKLFKKISEDYKDHYPVDENGTTKVRSGRNGILSELFMDNFSGPLDTSN